MKRDTQIRYDDVDCSQAWLPRPLGRTRHFGWTKSHPSSPAAAPRGFLPRRRGGDCGGEFSVDPGGLSPVFGSVTFSAPSAAFFPRDFFVAPAVILLPRRDEPRLPFAVLLRAEAPRLERAPLLEELLLLLEDLDRERLRRERLLEDRLEYFLDLPPRPKRILPDCFCSRSLRLRNYSREALLLELRLERLPLRTRRLEVLRLRLDDLLRERREERRRGIVSK
ncbi:hypothetical protein Y032_0013g2119 [Ancylostoma ceylanicum]|uniref:Uncharacterized protein n=1 Tax=Ancylostoma ceylanicum TaxID=53326 RepID=A0A016VDI4_9BILA|nr:hypothetical protein Y032_0013g2119 [Ancylostoma ceylanicum]